MNKKNEKWYLYVIRTSSKSLYCGITTDVNRRFDEHNSQGKKCAKYLRGKGPLKLVYTEEAGSKTNALQLEYFFKSLSKDKKEELIKD